jgi:CO/xanthine dehydrogenase Mo-binding subunit
MLLYVVVDDFGSMIDLLLLFGQMNGGVAQGVNQAMLSAPFRPRDQAALDRLIGRLLPGPKAC